MSDFVIRIEHPDTDHPEILISQEHEKQPKQQGKNHALEWGEFKKALKERKGRKWKVEFDAHESTPGTLEYVMITLKND